MSDTSSARRRWAGSRRPDSRTRSYAFAPQAFPDDFCAGFHHYFTHLPTSSVSAWAEAILSSASCCSLRMNSAVPQSLVTAPREADDTCARTSPSRRWDTSTPVAATSSCRARISSVVSSTESRRAGTSISIDVALAHGRDRPAARSFRSDVAGHQSVRRAGETAVGEQRHGVAQPGADDGGGDGEHLAHAGPAARTFVANHDHVAGLDLVALHGGEGVFFAIEDARRTAMMRACRGRRASPRSLPARDCPSE